MSTNVGSYEPSVIDGKPGCRPADRLVARRPGTHLNDVFKPTVCYSDGPPMRPDDWASLQPNDRVCLHHHDKEITHGKVDVIAPDASIFWVWLDGGRGRAAVHHGDTVGVWYAATCP